MVLQLQVPNKDAHEVNYVAPQGAKPASYFILNA